jgi:hypothetical protein
MELHFLWHGTAVSVVPYFLGLLGYRTGGHFRGCKSPKIVFIPKYSTENELYLAFSNVAFFDEE